MREEAVRLISRHTCKAALVLAFNRASDFKVGVELGMVQVSGRPFHFLNKREYWIQSAPLAKGTTD